MKLHIISDIHLEYYAKISTLEELENKIPSLYETCSKETKDIILILAGDIGYITMNNYWKFLQDCSEKYKYVICITGNHEYYSIKNRKYDFDKLRLEKISVCENKIYNFDELESMAMTRSKDIKNLYYLLDDKITLDGITFIGTTMWSHIPNHVKMIISTRVNDYNCIYTNNKLITTEFINEIHDKQTKYILENITDNCVVITHHLPRQELIHEKYYPYEDVNTSIMATSLPEAIFDKRIKLWICGHTHTHMECKYNDISFIANPMGYYKENPNPHIVELEIN